MENLPIILVASLAVFIIAVDSGDNRKDWASNFKVGFSNTTNKPAKKPNQVSFLSLSPPSVSKKYNPEKPMNKRKYDEYNEKKEKKARQNAETSEKNMELKNKQELEAKQRRDEYLRNLMSSVYPDKGKGSSTTENNQQYAPLPVPPPSASFPSPLERSSSYKSALPFRPIFPGKPLDGRPTNIVAGLPVNEGQAPRNPIIGRPVKPVFGAPNKPVVGQSINRAIRPPAPSPSVQNRKGISNFTFI